MTGIRKRKLFLPVAVAAAVMLAGVLAVTQFSSSAPAQAASPQSAQQARCSLATVKGTYVVNLNGVQLAGGQKRPFALAGNEVFDGRGHVHGVTSQSQNGNISRRVSFTATNTLNPDCTGTFTSTSAFGVVHYDAYTTPSGSRATFVVTDPGTVASGVAEKR